MSNNQGGPGFARLQANPRYADMVKRTLEEQARAVAEVRPQPVQAKRRKVRPAKDSDYPCTEDPANCPRPEAECPCMVVGVRK